MQTVVSNSLVLAKESDNILKTCLITHPHVVVAAPGLVDKPLVIPLPSRAVKLIAAIVIRRPTFIPSVCVIAAAPR